MSDLPPPPRDSTAELEAEWRRVLEESQRPLDRNLPPEALASPSHVPTGGAGDIRWWRPGWSDVSQHMGWRWVLLTPVVLSAVFGVLALLRPFVFLPFLGVEIWLLKISVGVSIAVIAYLVRRASHARREPFCVFCGYNLSGLPDNYRCPECGRPYTWRLIGEYRRDPSWFIERYKAWQNLPPADRPFDTPRGKRKRRRDGTA